MQRWQGAALAVVFFCAGCLDSMVEDAPGYSRWILPPGSVPPPATDDVTTSRKIDVNDGVTKPSITPKTGWAAGQQVMYWDFGSGKRGASPAYAIVRCTADGMMQPTDPPHPVIVDSIPGDSDYSPYRAFQYACVTDKYKSQVIPSLDAFNDAIDLGLITDPTATPATTWINQPIHTPDVMLVGGVAGQTNIAFYRDTSVVYETMLPQEGPFKYDPTMGVPTGNAYEIVKPGSPTPVKVIFSQPYLLADGSKNPSYSPAWIQVTVTLNRPAASDNVPANDMNALNAFYDGVLATMSKESDLVTVGMNNALTVVNTKAIASATATTTRVNRPFVVAKPPEAM
jgi:hypothetical protein